MCEQEEQFQPSNVCLICEKLSDNDNEKVRNQLENLDAKLIEVVTLPAIFHNLRGYDSHLIFDELKNFDVTIDVIPNTLEKYMAFL